MTFKCGDKVSWSSQAGGNTTSKQGVVLHVVPTGHDACRVIRSYEKMGKHRSAYGGGAPRGHESYLVEVRASEKSKPVIYWPLVNRLRPA